MSLQLFNVLFALFGFAVYVVSYFSRELNLPLYYENFCCADDRMLNLFLIFIPFMIFSIMIFRFDSQLIFRFSKISFIYLFIYLFIYFVAPTQGNGFIWFQRETVSLLGSVIYSIIIISLFFITLKNKK